MSESEINLFDEQQFKSTDKKFKLRATKDDHDRIKHIMEHQVYGFAPTRIIYLIATNYIFGFDKGLKDFSMEKHFNGKTFQTNRCC